MSIINLEKTFENEQLVYFRLANRIIECNCLSKLSKSSKYIVKDYNYEGLGFIKCNKIKVITIYDIYKNKIYEPVKNRLFKNPIKVGMILEKYIEYIRFFKTFMGLFLNNHIEYISPLKTFMRVFIKNDILNDVVYNIDYKGSISEFSCNNILVKINNYTKIFNIYDKEKIIYKFAYERDLIIHYNNYNDCINNEIKYINHSNYIKISVVKYPSYQSIYFYKKNLKIFKINKYYKNIEDIYEKRNDNNEITHYMEYNYTDNIKEKFISNYSNPPFSKPLRKNCMEIINNYKKNINIYVKLINYCLKKEIIVNNKLLISYKLEIINSK